MIDSVKKEFQQHKPLLVVLTFTVLLSYSVYVFMSEEMVSKMGDEDGLFEYFTAIFFLAACLVFGRIFFRTRKIFFLLLSIVLFVGFGEEISWGQRIFGFGTPDYLMQHNVQGETTLHNIEILNSNDFDSTLKTGWRKMITVDFLYKLFCVSFGGLLPLMVYYIGFIRNLTLKISLPIPPFLLGLFFVINWLVFKLMLTLFLPSGRSLQYYDSVGEISEFVSAVVFFVITLAFYKTERVKVVLSK